MCSIDRKTKKLIEIVKSNSNVTQEEMAMSLGVSRFTIIREIKELEDKDIIKRDGSNKTGSWIIK